MVRAHEHGHERSRTRLRLDHTPIKTLPIGPLPGLNVPSFNTVATRAPDRAIAASSTASSDVSQDIYDQALGHVLHQQVRVECCSTKT